jgi:hypothetical protein
VLVEQVVEGSEQRDMLDGQSNEAPAGR